MTEENKEQVSETSSLEANPKEAAVSTIKENNSEESNKETVIPATDEVSNDSPDIEMSHLYVDEGTTEIIEPENPIEATDMASMTPAFQEILKKQGWSDLTLVQKKTIPYMRAGRDMMILSRTGSGKTGAFLIPLLEIIEVGHQHPQALILTPTRELALQIHLECEKLGASQGIKSTAIYGGVKYTKQIEDLTNGVHVVIATPGRLLDHLQRKNLDFNSLRDLVLDEADEMLSMGFYEDMKKIVHQLPEQYCTTLFSATIPVQVKSLSREFQSGERGFLSIKSKVNEANPLDHFFTVVDPLGKDQEIFKILQTEMPESAILFCNMKKDVQYMYEFLSARGFNVGHISGDVSQGQRQKTLTSFREKKLRVLIATDVAARGIDISHVTHVLLHDHPEDNEVYIHRAGRTARAGRKGKAISVVSPLEKLDLEKTSSIYNIEFKQLPNIKEEDVIKAVQKSLGENLEASYKKLKPVQQRQVKPFTKVAIEMANDPEQVEWLCQLLHREYLKEIGK